MQDSLENYIKLANNVNSCTVRAESRISNEKERNLITDKRALKIVEFAIDGQLRPEVFLKCLNYINPSFYQDIVEERHLAQYCGYPICGNKIFDRYKKQYFISTKANKIYDITDRKNFCSNFCYKASHHIKQQIESSPLLSRSELDCPKFQLLLATEHGIPGEEILVIKKNTDESAFTSVSDFAEASLDEAQEEELSTEFKRVVIEKNEKEKETKLATSAKINIANKYAAAGKRCKDTADKAQEDRRSDLVKEVKSEVVENCKSLDKRLKMALEKVKRMKEDGVKRKSVFIEISKDPEMIRKSPMGKSQTHYSKEDLQSSTQGTQTITTEEIGTEHLPNIDNIFHCFTTWTTLDTFLFLHGEDRIRTALTERKLTDLFDRLHVSELSVAQQVRYRDIYRRMHAQDMLEKRKDDELMEGKKGKARKPLPEYADLKRESKDLTVKVKAFLSGVSFDPSSSCVQSFKDASSDSRSLLQEVEDTAAFVQDAEVNEQVPSVLPFLDHSSRSAIRRRIFLNSANPQVRKHLVALNLEENLMEPIQQLVHTFQLSSKNIVFKPNEWKLIGIALLEILSIRNEDLQIYLKTDDYNDYIQTEFSSIVDFKDYIVGIKNYLQNVELFIELYISSDK